MNFKAGIRNAWKWLSNTRIPGPYVKFKFYFLFIFGLLLFFPLFIVLSKFIPANNWPLFFDIGLLAFLLLLVIYLAIRLTYRILFITLAICFCALLWGTVRDGYGFKELIDDYTDFTYVVTRSAQPQDIIISKLSYFPNKVAFSKAIDFNSPEVRTFSLRATRKYFKDAEYPRKYKQIVHSLAIFKEINSQWYYVSDPAFREYYAKPQESIKTLAGDCDDHTILMASCIKLVGGTVRMVYTEKHVFPELFLGQQAEADTIFRMIKWQLFPEETKRRLLHFQRDENQNIWLNLDYTARYPGGPFLNEKVLGTYTLY